MSQPPSPPKQPHFVEPPADPGQRQRREPYYGPEHWRKIHLWARAHEKELSENDNHLYQECRATYSLSHIVATLTISVPGVLIYSWYARRNGTPSRSMWPTAVGITLGSYFYGMYKAGSARKDCIDAMLQLDSPLGSIARQVVGDVQMVDAPVHHELFSPTTHQHHQPPPESLPSPNATTSAPPAPSPPPFPTAVTPMTRVSSWREWRRQHQQTQQQDQAPPPTGSETSSQSSK